MNWLGQCVLCLLKPNVLRTPNLRNQPLSPDMLDHVSSGDQGYLPWEKKRRLGLHEKPQTSPAGRLEGGRSPDRGKKVHGNGMGIGAPSG